MTGLVIIRAKLPGVTGSVDVPEGFSGVVAGSGCEISGMMMAINLVTWETYV